jgi:UvrD-like helicase C-terminal domain/AAA domain
VTVRAFSGGAGCGKTYRLMETLTDYLEQIPLEHGRKILALTFMHGSRRRLNERLRKIPVLGTKYECSTIDSFALRILYRWQSLAAHLGFAIPNISNYDQICEIAATLLEHDVVVRWVAGTFPVLVLDEAQDLTPVRLRIICALSVQLKVFAAADEFQCLNEQLRPNPACDWLTAVANIEHLEVQWRTKVPALLEAAKALRTSTAPVSTKPFMITLTPNYQFAGAYIANELGWYGQNRRVAIITPTAGRFAKEVVDWVGVNTSSKGNGPYLIPWERSESDAANEVVAQLVLADGASLIEVGTAIQACGNPHVAIDMMRWLNIQRRARGRTNVTRVEVEDVIRQSLSVRRRMHQEGGIGFRAMTIHGAKNREFDNVIVLWPAAVGGSDDQKRRLLYNAITRAKSRCLVLVQAKILMESAPFV